MWVSNVVVPDPEVISTQVSTPPNLMPVEGRVFGWWRRTFRCANHEHTPVWSQEDKTQAQTRYCWFCGVVISVRQSEHAEPPSTGGRVMHAYGNKILNLEHDTRIETTRDGVHLGRPALDGYEWGEAEEACECKLPANHTRECQP